MNPWKWTTLGLCGVLVVLVGTGSGTAEAKAPRDVLMAVGMLEAGKRELMKAPKDEAGHRTKAIDTTRAAMVELRIIAFGKEGAKFFPK